MPRPKKKQKASSRPQPQINTQDIIASPNLNVSKPDSNVNADIPVFSSSRDPTAREAQENFQGTGNSDSAGRDPLKTATSPLPSPASKLTTDCKDQLRSSKLEKGDASSRDKTTGRDIYRSFACPLAKENINLYGDCFKHFIKRENDISQHLFRAHLCTCKNCKPPDYQGRVHKYCQESMDPDRRWLTASEYSALKHLVRKDEIGRWFAIWNILFPHLGYPATPYFERYSNSALLDFKNFVSTVGLKSLLLKAASRKIEVSSELQEVLSEGIRDFWPLWTLHSGGEGYHALDRVSSSEEKGVKTIEDGDTKPDVDPKGAAVSEFDAWIAAQEEAESFDTGAYENEFLWAFDEDDSLLNQDSLRYSHLDSGLLIGNEGSFHGIADELNADGGFTEWDTGFVDPSNLLLSTENGLFEQVSFDRSGVRGEASTGIEDNAECGLASQPRAVLSEQRRQIFGWKKDRVSDSGDPD